MRVLSRALFVVFLLGLWLGGAVPMAAAPGDGAPEVDAQVREALARGEPADVLILLDSRPDLSPARALPTKEARGRWVYDTLRAAADRDQGPLVAELARSGVPHRRFWAVNAVQARLNASQLQRVLASPRVTRVAANLSMRAVEPPPAASAGATALVAPDTVEWGVNRVKAPWAWSQGYTGQGIVVAGQDTGYAWDHPALINAYRGYDPLTGLASHDYNWHDSIHSQTTNSACGHDSVAPCDDHGHGTHTMGTMLGNDLAPGSADWPAAATNAIGVAPGADWIGCRNMDQGNGTPATYIECFEWFIAPYPVAGGAEDGDPSKAPDVMDNSWGCISSEGCTLETLGIIEPALNAADAAGIVVVVSAGNSGSACGTIWNPPAIYPRAFTVGSTSSADGLANSSSRGPVTYAGQTYVKPDVSAPGVSVRSSWPRNFSVDPNQPYRLLSGTSMAAPHVVGVLALVLSAQPSLRGQTDLIKTIVARTADPMTYATCGGAPGGLPNNGYGWGIVNAQRAIDSFGQAGTLSGLVTDASTGLPLAGATVTLHPLGGGAPFATGETDIQGRYSLPAPWGSYRVAVASSGYLPAEPVAHVVGGFTTAQDVALPLRPPFDLAIGRTGVTAVGLRWTDVGSAADHYVVWRGTAPYFTPGDPAAGSEWSVDVAPVPGEPPAWQDATAMGDPPAVHFYVVRTVNAAGGQSANSPRVGVWTFPLTP
jgi:subtilisin family serine protease